MDGENDAAQSGQVEATGAGAASQADGDAQGAGGGAIQAQEIAAAGGAADAGAGGASDNADLQARLAERDARIAELEARLESQKVDHELQLAGCRSTRAARALLGDHDGDVAALKEAEPWLFNDASRSQTETSSEAAEGGTTGLKPAGAEQSAATVARWERLADLSDNEEKE